MKKIFIMLAMLLAFGTVNADNVNGMRRTYVLNQNDEKVSRYLELDSNQAGFLHLLHEDFNLKLSDAEKRQELDLEPILESEIQKSKGWLTPKQYKKYEQLVRLTFENRGFNVKKRK